MADRGLEWIDETTERTCRWIDEVREALGVETRHQAFLVLRAFLAALRDYLTVDEAAHLSAQLPLLLRGVFWTGWDPGDTSRRSGNGEVFLARMAMDAMLEDHPGPREAVPAAWSVILQHIDPGQLRHVLRQLPGGVRELLLAA